RPARMPGKALGIVREEKEHNPMEEANSLPKVTPTVLVVDDDANVRTALARLIRSVGLQVDTFASVPEFLDRQRPDGPTCLVLDVRLPWQTGMLLPDTIRTTQH